MSATFEDIKKTGSLTAASPTLDINNEGAATAVFQLTGTWSGTVTFQAMVDEDGSPTWVAVKALKAGTTTYATTTTSNGIYYVPIGAVRSVRANFSAPTSGTVVTTIRAGAAPYIAFTEQAGGGAAVSVADGADVALGTTTDAGVTTDTTGTVIGFLRGNIIKWVSALTQIGIVTEAAPATDTASSGLNGRLQRVAQRLTSLIALLPTALGGTTSAASLPVVLSSDGPFATQTGSITETAPATDTASSGLNGRLQRIAQRITSLIALIPAALTGSGNFKVAVAESTATVTVDTEMPAAALDGDTFDIAATAIPKVGAILHAMSAGGTLAGRVLSHTSASDGRANTLNGLLVQSVPYTRNAANTNDAQRGINAATATTGTGIPSAGPALWDLVGTTNYVRQAGDGSGRSMVVGPVAAGAAVTGNPVILGASDGTNIQYLKVDSASNPNLRVALFQGGVGPAVVLNTTSDTNSSANSGMLCQAQPHLFNGTNWERQRSNVDVTLLASAARTTTQTSADITTYNAHSIIVTVDVTATVSTVSLTLAINYKDPASGKYLPLLTGTTIAATGTFTYAVNPNTPTATGPWTKVAQSDLGRIIQIVLTVGNANSQTYSIGYTLVP